MGWIVFFFPEDCLVLATVSISSLPAFRTNLAASRAQCARDQRRIGTAGTRARAGTAALL